MYTLQITEGNVKTKTCYKEKGNSKKKDSRISHRDLRKIGNMPRKSGEKVLKP